MKDKTNNGGGWEVTHVADVPTAKDNPYWSKIVSSVKRECKTCRWLNSADTGAADGNTCRRHAPITEAGRQAHRMWPYIFETDWCGDWEKRND